MTLKIELTPNKDIIKIIAPKILVENSYEISRDSQIKNIPIAQQLMNLPFVENIFITANFIAIKKNNMVDWEMVSDDLLELIGDELEANPNIILEEDEISIITELTPNPQVMKFSTNRTLINGIIEIKTQEQSSKVPLAKYLFSFDYIKEIFITENFISITKKDNYSWENISEEIKQNISEYLSKETHITNIENQNPYKPTIIKSDYTDTELKIKNILDEYVAPAIYADGGYIDLISFDTETKTAKMLLQGACSGCPSSTITLKKGIETLLKEMLPGIVEQVESINS